MTEVHHHITQGRMNPITVGHEAVVNQVRRAAGSHGHTIVLTGTHDAKKNPLTPEQKLKHAKRAFPGANVRLLDKEHPTLLHQLSRLHSEGVTHLHLHVGSDRAHEFHALTHKYNGVEGRHGYYKFKKITIHTVGKERSDADTGVAGASGTKMRQHAAAGNEKEFHKMAPSAMSTKHKHELYKDVRHGMGIHESLSFSSWIAEGMALPSGAIRGLGSVSGNADLSDFQDQYTANTVVDTDNRNNIIFQRLKQHMDNHKKDKVNGTNN